MDVGALFRKYVEKLEEDESKVITVYYVVNGEDRISDEFYHRIADILKSLLDELRPFLTWLEDERETGCFYVRMYKISNTLVVRKEWISKPGYSWEEEIIEIIT